MQLGDKAGGGYAVMSSDRTSLERFGYRVVARKPAALGESFSIRSSEGIWKVGRCSRREHALRAYADTSPYGWFSWACYVGPKIFKDSGVKAWAQSNQTSIGWKHRPGTQVVLNYQSEKLYS